MADIYTGAADEQTIKDVLEKGLGVGTKSFPKWTVLRLALAHSLHIATHPAKDLDRIEDRSGGSEYHLEQVTGKGLHSEENDTDKQDYDAAICALLSTYHEQNLFQDLSEYKRLLQRHIRRGLKEFRLGWRESHDFHDFLYQELFADVDMQDQIQPGLHNELAQGLNEIGIKGEIRETLSGPRLTRFLLHLPNVNDLDRLNRGLPKLSFFLGLQEQGVFTSPTNESKVVGLDVPRQRETWQMIKGHQLAEWIRDYQGEAILPVWPGVDVLGQPYMFDLAKAPHLLVGGTTGSGKSVCLHALLVSLLRGPAREHLKLLLIDPKLVEFDDYRTLKQQGHQVVHDAEEAYAELNELVDIMEARMQRFAELGVRDLGEAFVQGVTDMPYMLVFVDELADLMMQHPDLEQPLVRLAQKARASGIHLVLATQRPDSATFTGLLRSNIPARIALTVQKSSESKIILDNVGAERLTGAGDMLVKPGQGDLVRIHGVKVMSDDIQAATHFGRGG